MIVLQDQKKSKQDGWKWETYISEAIFAKIILTDSQIYRQYFRCFNENMKTHTKIFHIIGDTEMFPRKHPVLISPKDDECYVIVVLDKNISHKEVGDMVNDEEV